jgi:hypothetical protein
LSWTPVADLDPQLADAMLQALREEGVAAYAAPTEGVRGAYLEIRMLDRPTDRLFVDATATSTAARVLQDQLPRLRAALDVQAVADADEEPAKASPAVDEDVWSAIVAGFDATTTDPIPRWPVSEDVDDENERRSGRVLRPAVQNPPEGQDWPASQWRAAGPPPEDPVEHYVPPEPPPLPEGDVLSRFAWIGLIGGPIFLLVAAILGWELTGWVATAPLVAFMAGFVTLVARMRDRPHDDSDPDDGAVV